MKKMKFFAMAFAALAIASCSKEQSSQDVVPPVVEGIETYATFNFTVEGSDSKSKAGTADTALDTNEAGDDIKDIRIAIFGADGKLEATNLLTTTGMTSTSLKVTSGVKRIFVFANSAATVGFPVLTEGSVLADCYASELSMVGTKLAPSAFSVGDLVGATKGYFMSNARTAKSLCTLYPNISADASKNGSEAQNHFTFEVSKAVSKVRAKLASDDVMNVGDKATPVAKLSSMTYTVKNLNKAVRPVQLFTNESILDADVEAGTPMAAFYNAFDGTAEKPINMTDQTTFDPYYDRTYKIDQSLSSTASTNYIYVTENTNAKQVVGNTSYLAIQAVYTPTNVVTACTYNAMNGGAFTITEAKPTTGATFYRINLSGLKNIGGVSSNSLKNNLFSDKTIAEATLKAVLLTNGHKEDTDINKALLSAEMAERLSEYTGGLTYYRLNIGRKEDGSTKTIYGIRRNSKYEITINSISKLGSNTEDGLDTKPETPVVSQETYVTATITVKEWQDYQQEGDL